MKLKDLFETRPVYQVDDYEGYPASEVHLKDEYKNENYGKKRKAKRQKVVIRGQGGKIYGVKNIYQ